MKKSTFITSVAGLSLAVLFMNTEFAHAQISAEQAKNIALQHAKVNATEVGFVQIKQDYDDGIMEYEVEFWKDNTEFDYTINANTGQIISHQQEVKQNFIANNQAPVTLQQNNQISIETATQKALSHAGLNKSQIRNLATYQDFDDGRYLYKVKFWKNYTEYEYEIDAVTGQIVEFDIDHN